MFYICGFAAGGSGVWGQRPQIKNYVPFVLSAL